MYRLKVKMLKDEYWYGGHTNRGYIMPVSEKSVMMVDTRIIKSYGQANTFFISNKGRIIYSENGFKTTFVFGMINCSSEKSEISLMKADDKSLRGAYLFVTKNFMPPSGKYPNELMFTSPQYCTWIELQNDQNEVGILDYAKSIIDAGMPVGELIIDDGWQETFGEWEFDIVKFENPKRMTDELHKMGFKIILWICPFISEKSKDFEYLKSNHLLVRDKYNFPAKRKWWNGEDYLLDFSNVKAQEWFFSKTDYLKEKYGIDGFKQDAGDAQYYRDDDLTYKNVDANTQSLLWAQSAERYDFNELRACFKFGNQGVAQRLADKSHRFGILGLGALLPNAMLQGISGYAFTCPDMIGGGQVNDFRDIPYDKLDHELFLRYCQTSALMPMMQFSLAIWNLGNEMTRRVAIESAKLHSDFSDYIIKCVKSSAKTGEPIVRYMEYCYPNCGYEKVKSQFMLGDDIIVAPVLKKGATEKSVYIPKGKWQYKGNKYENEIIKLPVKKDELIYFERVNDND